MINSNHNYSASIFSAAITTLTLPLVLVVGAAGAGAGDKNLLKSDSEPIASPTYWPTYWPTYSPTDGEMKVERNFLDFEFPTAGMSMSHSYYDSAQYQLGGKAGKGGKGGTTGPIRLAFKGTARPETYGCGDLTGAAKIACDLQVVEDLTATLQVQGLLCTNPPSPAALPCKVTNVQLAPEPEDIDRRLQEVNLTPLYSYIQYLTQGVGVTQAQIEAALESWMLYNNYPNLSWNATAFETTPIPTTPDGWEFIGLGLCQDITLERVWAACEYGNVPDIGTCASLCETSTCFNANNGYTLSGLFYQGNYCYCLKPEGGQTESPCPCYSETLTAPITCAGCGHECNEDRGDIYTSTANSDPTSYAEYTCLKRL